MLGHSYQFPKDSGLAFLYLTDFTNPELVGIPGHLFFNTVSYRVVFSPSLLDLGGPSKSARACPRRKS